MKKTSPVVLKVKNVASHRDKSTDLREDLVPEREGLKEALKKRSEDVAVETLLISVRCEGYQD
jgi:hypothetical protein